MTPSTVLLRWSRMLEGAVVYLGLAFAWLALPLLILFGVLNVAGRWLPLGGTAALYELGADLFFALVMLSFGCAYLLDGHVRVDIFRGRFGLRCIAWIELLGCLGIAIPLSWVLVSYGGEGAWRAFAQGERGVGDLPVQWIVKASVPLGFLGLFLAAFCVAIRNALFLLGRHDAPSPGGDVAIAASRGLVDDQPRVDAR